MVSAQRSFDGRLHTQENRVHFVRINNRRLTGCGAYAVFRGAKDDSLLSLRERSASRPRKLCAIRTDQSPQIDGKAEAAFPTTTMNFSEPQDRRRRHPASKAAARREAARSIR